MQRQRTRNETRKSGFAKHFWFSKILQSFLQALQKIQVDIVSLELIPNSIFLRFKKPKFLYVEYEFLGHFGHLLETESLKLPDKTNTPIFFKYTQEFFIKPDIDVNKMKILKSMVEKDSTNPMKFRIIDEPIEMDEVDSENECKELGQVLMNSKCII